MSKVHFIVDEASSVRHLESIDDALNLGRGFGIRMFLFYQSVAQLKLCFPEGQEQAVMSNSTQVFFGVNDQQTAELVSNRLGDRTAIVDSGGSSWGSNRSHSVGRDGSASHGTNEGGSLNWGQQARKLLTADEVVHLPATTAITFAPGVRPVRTTLLRYYEQKHWGRRGRFRRFGSALAMLVKSTILCGLSLGLASHLMQAANARAHRPVPRPSNPYFRERPCRE